MNLLANDPKWTRLSAGTMQWLPDLQHTYQIVKLQRIVAPDDGCDVTTYMALKLTGKAWQWLGSHDEFSGAKQIVMQDWQLGFGADSV